MRRGSRARWSSSAGRCSRWPRWRRSTRTWGPPRQTAETAALQLNELVRDLRDFAEGVEYDQHRLADIEERLNLISSLKRKYGDSVEEVLEFETRANTELARLNSHGLPSVAHLEAQVRALRSEAGVLAAGCRPPGARPPAGSTAAVEEQLGGLGMQGARLGVSFGLAADPVGLEPGPGGPAAGDSRLRARRSPRCGRWRAR